MHNFVVGTHRQLYTQTYLDNQTAKESILYSKLTQIHGLKVPEKDYAIHKFIE